jgi:hypothetical protein
VVLFLPATLVPDALTEAHGELLTGHTTAFTRPRSASCSASTGQGWTLMLLLI